MVDMQIYADVLPNYYATVMSKLTFLMCKISGVSHVDAHVNSQSVSKCPVMPCL